MKRGKIPLLTFVVFADKLLKINILSNFNKKRILPRSEYSRLAATAAVSVEAQATKVEMTTVGRWMCREEYDAMKHGGRMLEGDGGKTSVSIGDFNSFTGAAKGSVYAEFQVPTNSLVQGGKSIWYSILGPSASKSQLFMLQKQGGQLLPQIQNLSPILKIK